MLTANVIMLAICLAPFTIEHTIKPQYQVAYLYTCTSWMFVWLAVIGAMNWLWYFSDGSIFLL